jgi:2-polyprenyl-3-methyl-5-hydroxy-6-metoxy-1,4-benzoquinol methylase
MSSKIVPEYDSRNILIRNLFLKRLKLAIKVAEPFLFSNPKSNVGDFGCGDGILLKFLEEKYKNIKIFGLDILPEVLSLKKSLRADIRVVDLAETGFPGAFFDVIFCLDTLEHFKNLADPVNEIKKTLKNDGILVVSLPTESFVYKLGRFLLKGTFSSEGGPSSSPHFYGAKEVSDFLSKNSFISVKKEKITKIPFLTFFEIILFKKNTI